MAVDRLRPRNLARSIVERLAAAAHRGSRHASFRHLGAITRGKRAKGARRAQGLRHGEVPLTFGLHRSRLTPRWGGRRPCGARELRSMRGERA